MISASVIIYAVSTIMVGLITYMAKRYIVRQDAKMDLLFEKFETLTTTFIDSVNELKDSINNVATGSTTHRALCDERNSNVHSKIKFIESAIQDLYNKVNVLWPPSKINKQQ